jgi:cytochrome c oxidase subunit 2
MTPSLQSVLSPAGPDALLLSRLGWLLFAGCAVIFLLVAALTLASVARRRRRPSSRILVFGGGILLPLPLLAALMGWSGWQAAQLTWPFSGTRIQVTVTGHMWWWQVRYRDTVSGREAVLANELRLPAGERVYLALASADVLHAFWVPALAGKVDMVPGRIHGLTLQADKPGHYRGMCAEYCGTQHTAMALDVVVETPHRFDEWLARQAGPAAAKPVGDAAIRGRSVFLSARCNACHSVRGVAEGGTAGPDLTHLASRRHLGAGALPLERASLVGWLADPQAFKPGARMPASSLPPEDLEALAAWLETLR